MTTDIKRPVDPALLEPLVGLTVVRGNDGRVLGVIFDGKTLDRDDCESWPDFLEAVAHMAMVRMREDCESETARRMIDRDDRRLRGLLIEVVHATE